VSATVGTLLAETAAVIGSNPTAAPRAEAEILLAHALGLSRAQLWARPEAAVAPAAADAARALARRRAAGEPVAYLVGRRAFWTIELEVGPAALIPRLETELIVEQALALLPASAAACVADLGTGSGAIALALAAERPAWRIVATDASGEALALARRNAARLRLTVDFRQGDWAGALRPGEVFDLVASNPPYVAEGDPHLTEGDLPWEPVAALTAGADGLDAIRQIAPAALTHLHAGGWLLLEHGAQQGPAVRAILARAGFGAIDTLRDLAGLERVTLGRRAGAAP
jgi:release factor glutamine methyltransferase